MEKSSASCCAPTVPKTAPGRMPAWATRNRLLMAGGAVLVGAAYLKWGWLTAIGAAPILLALAPCGIMCAMGICSKGMKKTPTDAASLPSATKE